MGISLRRLGPMSKRPRPNVRTTPAQCWLNPNPMSAHRRIHVVRHRTHDGRPLGKSCDPAANVVPPSEQCRTTSRQCLTTPRSMSCPPAPMMPAPRPVPRTVTSTSVLGRIHVVRAPTSVVRPFDPCCTERRPCRMNARPTSYAPRTTLFLPFTGRLGAGKDRYSVISASSRIFAHISLRSPNIPSVQTR